MSNREVKGLSIAHIVEERTRSEKQRKMADRDTTESELLAEVERLRAELSRRDGEVAELKTEVTRAHAWSASRNLWRTGWLVWSMTWSKRN